MRILLLGPALLAIVSGAAMAQSSSETTTTQQTGQAPVAPAPGTLSSTRTAHSQDSNGDTNDSKSTSYRDSTGVAKQSESVTRTAAPPPPPVTSTTTSTQSTTSPQ
jgi:hypothetical protein